MAEIATACKKHPSTAIELKKVNEDQKKKLKEYREANSKLYDEIYSFEDDIKEKENYAQK